MPAEFIYSTYKLARHYPPDRTVLEDISLSFYPGAKIGVIGPNGAGKSSLLKIMAGLDDGFTGEARLTPGFTVGYLQQEPQLDATKDVKQNVLDGVRPVQDLIDAVQRGHGQVVRSGRRLRGDRRRAGRARGQDQRGRRVEPGTERRHRDGRASVSARRRRRRDALGRGEAPGRARPAAPAASRPAAPRRAHQPPRCRVGRVARTLPLGVFGHRRGHHPRPLLPRQRREVDPRARSRARHPVLGQLQQLARAEARAAHRRGQGRRRPPAHARPRARLGAPLTEGPPIEGQGPPLAPTSSCSAKPTTRSAPSASSRSPSRRGRAWATRSSRSTACARGSATGCSSRT